MAALDTLLLLNAIIHVQDAKYSPSSTPTTLLGLLTRHVLLGSETGDVCIVKLHTPGDYHQT